MSYIAKLYLKPESSAQLDGRKFYIVRTPFASYAECVAALNDPDDQLIACDLLHTHRAGKDYMRITRTDRYAVRPSAIDAFFEPSFKYIEADEDVPGLELEAA